MSPELSYFRNEGGILFEALLVCLSGGLHARASRERGLGRLGFPGSGRGRLFLTSVGLLRDRCFGSRDRIGTGRSGGRAGSRLLSGLVAFARARGRGRRWSGGFKAGSIHVSKIDDRQAGRPVRRLVRYHLRPVGRVREEGSVTRRGILGRTAGQAFARHGRGTLGRARSYDLGVGICVEIVGRGL